MKRAQSTHSDESPAPDALETAARVLQRPASYRDARGYQCDLLAAAIHPTLNQIAYVESRSKKRWWTTMWDVSIQVHFWHASGVRRRAEIKSYNPFFGCEVEHFAWMGDEVLLIYSEKHKTYACSFGSRWPPRFVEIQFPWTIRGSVLQFLSKDKLAITHLSLPELSLSTVEPSAASVTELFSEVD